jgi:hypothetical protein
MAKEAKAGPLSTGANGSTGDDDFAIMIHNDDDVVVVVTA